jgi:hypothetical protein
MLNLVERTLYPGMLVVWWLRRRCPNAADAEMVSTNAPTFTWPPLLLLQWFSSSACLSGHDSTPVLCVSTLLLPVCLFNFHAFFRPVGHCCVQRRRDMLLPHPEAGRGECGAAARAQCAPDASIARAAGSGERGPAACSPTVFLAEVMIARAAIEVERELCCCCIPARWLCTACSGCS